MGDSLGVDYGIEVGSSFALSGGCVERKLDIYSVEFERRDSGARVEMVAGLLALGVDAVSVAAVVVSDSDLR